MRRRLLMKSESPASKYHLAGETCDAVFWDSLGERFIYVSPEDINIKDFPAEVYTPIGVVVVPSSHNIYPEQGACGVMSIVPMNYSTPNTGGTNEQNIYWGYYNIDISDKSDGLGRTDSVTNGLQDYSDYGYIPRQGSTNGMPSWQGSKHLENPYNDSSSALSSVRNENYGKSGCTSDFKGIVNTKILTDLGQSDWKTASTITNNSEKGYTPAACCCARFKTTGTKSFAECTTEELKNGSGFWYLPAAGELGYIIPRLYDINATIRSLKSAYKVGVSLSTDSNNYWSSSEYSSNNSYCMNMGNGYVDYRYKSGNPYVRAFLRLKPTPEYVDLGLPSGNLWATCNLGAGRPEEGGLFFKWGDPRGFTADEVIEDPSSWGGWSNYKHGDGTTNPIKYNDSDGKLELDLEDDPANVYLGGNWRSPSKQDLEELIDCCTFEKTSDGGSKIISKVNKNQIFIPSAGNIEISGVFIDSGKYTWSRTGGSSNIVGAYRLRFSDQQLSVLSRVYGLSIRPVHPKIPPKKTTFTLDQTQSDPTKIISGEFGMYGDPDKNVVSWIRANSHRYVGTYDSSQGMLLKQLDDNDSTKYADGSDASTDITTKDVFMRMPTFWYHGESVDGSEDVYNVVFTTVEPKDGVWEKWDENTLIGAYKAVAEDTGNNMLGRVYSRSGATPTVDVSQGDFKAKARNRSNGDDHFMLVTYEAHKVMALLFACYYGNTNGQAIIGSGTSEYPKTTGATNVDGMNDTVAQNSRSINFWGLENWWGDIYEWVDNLLSTGGSNSNNGLDVKSYTGDTVRSMRSTYDPSYMKRAILGDCLDLLPMASSSNGSTTAYYCDSGYVSSSAGRVGLRSYYGADDYGGPFCLNVGYSASRTDSSVGSRLVYEGRCIVS